MAMGINEVNTVKSRNPIGLDIIGMLRASSFNFNPNSRSLTRACTYDYLTSSHGFYLRKDCYLTKLTWVAKMVPLDNWYEKDTLPRDGGDAYARYCS